MRSLSILVLAALAAIALPPAFAQMSDMELVEKHIPIFYFSRTAENDCYPDEAKDENDNICKPFNQDAPLYYSIQKCQGYIKIAYWVWYGWQGKCLLVFGGHGNDWEHVVVNLRPDQSMHSVTYYQHNGYFTDCTQPPKPIVYIGKISHGSYNNPCSVLNIVDPFRLAILGPDFCTNSCFYWDDHRLEGGQEWKPTKDNLKPLPTTGNIAKRHDDEDYFSPATKNHCFDPIYGLRLGVLQNGCWFRMQDGNCKFPAPDDCKGLP